MWRTRWKRARACLLQRIPFTENNGLQARAEGRLEAWLLRSDITARQCDGVVACLLTLSAMAALGALFFSNAWLAGLAGLSMAGLMFTMAAEIWIEQEAEKVREATFGRN